MTYVELLFFAYRDFTSDPDSILQELGFGRAHHRVLHFVKRYPGMRVADLLQILKITKQSLARVLRDLLTTGHIERRTGPSDRRERLLFATPKGISLAETLAKPQLERIAATLSALEEVAHPLQSADDARHEEADHQADRSRPSHQDIAQNFLYHMITASERAAVDALMRRRVSGAHIDTTSPENGLGHDWPAAPSVEPATSAPTNGRPSDLPRIPGRSRSGASRKGNSSP